MRVRKKKWADQAIKDTTQCFTMAETAVNKGKWRAVIQNLQAASQVTQADAQAPQAVAAGVQASQTTNITARTAQADIQGERQTVPAADVPLYLEIGCGKGKFICELAQQDEVRSTGAVLIGVDMEINALCFAARKISEASLPIALLYGSAAELDQVFAAGEADRLYLNFSTPWPKLKHHKRRLTYPLFLQTYLHILKDGGEIFLKTDNPDFFHASKAYLTYMGFALTAENENLALVDDPTGIVTEYEARWRNEELPIHFLRAVKLSPAELTAAQAYWQREDSPLFADEKLAYDFRFYRKLLQNHKSPDKR